MKRGYIVRGYLLSQHLKPFLKMVMETRDLAIALGEVLLEDQYHCVIIMNESDDDEEVIMMKKEFEYKPSFG